MLRLWLVGCRDYNCDCQVTVVAEDKKAAVKRAKEKAFHPCFEAVDVDSIDAVDGHKVTVEE